MRGRGRPPKQAVACSQTIELSPRSERLLVLLKSYADRRKFERELFPKIDSPAWKAELERNLVVYAETLENWLALGYNRSSLALLQKAAEMLGGFTILVTTRFRMGLEGIRHVQSEIDTAFKKAKMIRQVAIKTSSKRPRLEPREMNRRAIAGQAGEQNSDEVNSAESVEQPVASPNIALVRASPPPGPYQTVKVDRLLENYGTTEPVELLTPPYDDEVEEARDATDSRGLSELRSMASGVAPSPVPGSPEFLPGAPSPLLPPVDEEGSKRKSKTPSPVAPISFTPPVAVSSPAVVGGSRVDSQNGSGRVVQRRGRGRPRKTDGPRVEPPQKRVKRSTSVDRDMPGCHTLELPEVEILDGEVFLDSFSTESGLLRNYVVAELPITEGKDVFDWVRTNGYGLPTVVWDRTEFEVVLDHTERELRLLKLEEGEEKEQAAGKTDARITIPPRANQASPMVHDPTKVVQGPLAQLLGGELARCTPSPRIGTGAMADNRLTPPIMNGADGGLPFVGNRTTPPSGNGVPTAGSNLTPPVGSSGKNSVENRQMTPRVGNGLAVGGSQESGARGRQNPGCPDFAAWKRTPQINLPSDGKGFKLLTDLCPTSQFTRRDVTYLLTKLVVLASEDRCQFRQTPEGVAIRNAEPRTDERGAGSLSPNNAPNSRPSGTADDDGATESTQRNVGTNVAVSSSQESGKSKALVDVTRSARSSTRSDSSSAEAVFRRPLAVANRGSVAGSASDRSSRSGSKENSVPSFSSAHGEKSRSGSRALSGRSSAGSQLSPMSR